MGWIWRSSWGHLKYSTLLEGAIWSASEPSSIKLDAWCIRTSTLAATWQWWIRLLGQRSLSISCNHFEPLSCNNLTMQLRHARSTISVVSIEKKNEWRFFFWKFLRRFLGAYIQTFQWSLWLSHCTYSNSTVADHVVSWAFLNTTASTLRVDQILKLVKFANCLQLSTTIWPEVQLEISMRKNCTRDGSTSSPKERAAGVVIYNVGQ